MKLIVKLLAAMAAAGFFVVLSAAIFIFFVLVPKIPEVNTLEDTEFQVPLRIYDKNDFLLAEYGDHRRIPVKYEDVPGHVEKAFLAAEDDQFWEHVGVDPFALAAAAYELVKTGRKTRGGSTITMQVARNFFLSAEKTYSRKLNEILLALKIERDLNKKTILELYLNKIYLGKRAYGVVAAAQVYYGKNLDELSIAQTAMIAGLPKAPSRYNPLANAKRALIRRNHILGRMLQLNYISEAEYEVAKAEPITAELHRSEVSADARYVTEMVRAEVYQKYGKEVYGSGLSVYTTIDDRLQTAANQSLRRALLDYDRRHGYRGAHAHIDLEKVEQNAFEEGLVKDESIGGLRKAVVRSIDEDKIIVMLPDYEQAEVLFKGGLDWARPFLSVDSTGKAPKTPADIVTPGDVVWLEKRDQQWLLASVPDVQGAIVSLDPSSGAILGLVGGFDFFHHKFNRVVQARRQPGSNFKPVIYSAALEKGLTAATVINDAPVVFEDDSLEASWRPENYSGRVYGPTRLREALVKSRNLVSIRVLQSIGLRFATRYAQRFGFKKEDLPYDLSLALGSGNFAPMEIVRAYSVLANGGYLVSPYYIDRIESRNGDILFEHKPLTVCQGCETVDDTSNEDEKIEGSVEVDLGPEYAPQVISAQNAYIMRSILREVVKRGTAVRAKALGRTDIAGKTGTTNDQKDAWFSGFNDQVVTTAWVGFDDHSTLGKRETGGRAALPMWMGFMREALKGLPENLEERPEGIVTVRIDSDTGKRATEKTERSRFEVFTVGTEPAEVNMPTTVGQKGTRAEKEILVEEEAVEDIF